MRPVRCELGPEDGGGWIEFDPAVPLAVFDAACEGARPDVRRFLELSIAGWSLGCPIPRDAPGVLDTEIPWHWWLLLPALFAALHRLRLIEEEWILQALSGGSARGVVPELAKARLCERLHVPFGPSYEQLPAGEILRLCHAFTVEAECRSALGK